MDKLFERIPPSTTPPATTPTNRGLRSSSGGGHHFFDDFSVGGDAEHQTPVPTHPELSNGNNSHAQSQHLGDAHSHPHATPHHVPHYAMGTTSSIHHAVGYHPNNEILTQDPNGQQQHKTPTNNAHHGSSLHNDNSSQVSSTQYNNGKGISASSTIASEETIQVVIRVRPIITELDEDDPEEVVTRTSRSAPNNTQIKSCISIINDFTVKVFSEANVPRVASRIDKRIESYGQKKENPTEKNFTFDRVFKSSSTQEEIYDMVFPFVMAAIEGYNSTIMAFGPHSGGKTYTMTGSLDEAGVIPRVVDTIYDQFSILSSESHSVVNVEMSYVEIYNNVFKNLLAVDTPVNGSGKFNGGVKNGPGLDSMSKDLDSEDSRDYDAPPLRGISRQFTMSSVTTEVNPTTNNNLTSRNADKIEIRESPIFGQFLSPDVRVNVPTADDAITMIAHGDTQRTFSQSGKATSTRGHAIITLFVESKVATEKEPPSEEKSYIKGKLRLGKIHLVDLASGERVSNTVAAGGELSEGLNINKSLLALNDVFHSLFVLASQSKKKKSADEPPPPTHVRTGSGASSTTVQTSATKTTPLKAAAAAAAASSSISKSTARMPFSSPVPSSSSSVATTPSTAAHVPYLHSKLTHYLRDSFGGNGKSIIVVNIPPGEKFYQDNIRALTLAAKAKKAINYPYPMTFEITTDISVDKKSEISVIAQLKQKMIDAIMRSPIKKGSKLSNLPAASRPKAYNFLIRNIALQDIPYVSFPMRPWLKLELKGATFRTQKQVNKGRHVFFLEEFTFELDAADYEAGVEIDIRAFNKIPFRSKVEIARIKFRILEYFPVTIDSKVKARISMEPLAPTDKTPLLLMHGSVRPSLASKVSFFDRSAPNTTLSPRKLPTVVCRQTIRTMPPPQFDPNKQYVLSLKSFTTTDALISTSETLQDNVGGYKFSIEAKFGPDKRRSGTIGGRARYRGKDKIATVFFDEPDLKFKTVGSAVKAESIYLILFVRGSDVSSQVVGRVIQPVAELLNVPGSEDIATMEFQAQMKDVTGKMTGRVSFSLTLHSTSVLKEADEYLDENYHIQRNMRIIPQTINQGWVRITSVEGIRMNTMKLLGLHARYCDSSCDEVHLHNVVKQDLLLVMEYGEHWVATSQLMQDQEDSCNWANLDFKIFAERDDLLKHSLKISVFNRKVEGKDGLIGSCAIALHQILDAETLSIMKAPIYLKTRRGKPNGKLLLNGVVVKDNGDSWMLAHVVKVRHDGKYDIQYEDGEVENNVSKDLLLLYNHDPRARHQNFRVNQARPRPKYPIGTKVEVTHGARDIWYPAVVIGEHGNQTYDIDTDYDIPKVNIPQSSLRPPTFILPPSDVSVSMGSNASVAMSTITNNTSPTNTTGGRSRTHRVHPKIAGYNEGDKVEANFKSKGKWYLATIYKVRVGDDGIKRYDIDYDSGVRELIVTDDKLRPAFATKYYHSSKAYHASGRLRESSNAPPMETAAGSTTASVGSTMNASITASNSSARQSQSPMRQRSSSFSNLLTASSGDDHSVSSHQDPALVLKPYEQHFEIGDRVFANYREHGVYLPGVVDDIDQDGLLTILYDHNNDSDGNVDPDTVRTVADHNATLVDGEDEATLTVASTITDAPNKTQTEFKISDKVEANYRGIGKWLPAQISKSRGGGVFDLVYEDGRIETKVTPDCMRIYDPDLKAEFKFEVGIEVEVNSKGLGYWYACKIAKQRNDGSYDITFEDTETETHVPEKFLRLPRRDRDIIPSEKPVFSVGDKVYVKSRSRAVEQEIKNFQENKQKAAAQLKELFVSMRSLEMEQGLYQWSKERCAAEKKKLNEKKIDLGGFDGVLIPLAELQEAKNVALKVESEEKVASAHQQDATRFEQLAFTSHNELTKKLNKISALENRLSKVCTHIALSTRSGLEEAEMHSITSGTNDLKSQLDEMEVCKTQCKEIVGHYSEARKFYEKQIAIFGRWTKNCTTLIESLTKTSDEVGVINAPVSSAPSPVVAGTQQTMFPGGLGNRGKGSNNNLPSRENQENQVNINTFNPMNKGYVADNINKGYSNAASNANSSINSRNSPVYADDDVGYDVYCNESYDDFSENAQENQNNASNKLLLVHTATVAPSMQLYKPSFLPSFSNILKTSLGSVLLGSKIPGREEYEAWNKSHPVDDDNEDFDTELDSIKDISASVRTNKPFGSSPTKKKFKKESLVILGKLKSANVAPRQSKLMFKYREVTLDNDNISFPAVEFGTKKERAEMRAAKEENLSGKHGKGEDNRIVEAKRSLEEKRLRSDLAELAFRKFLDSSKEKELCEAMQKCIDNFIADFHLKNVVLSRGSDEIDRNRQVSEQERKHAEACENKRIEAMKLAEFARDSSNEKFEDVLDNKRPDQAPIIVYAQRKAGDSDARTVVEDTRFSVGTAEDYIMLLEIAKRATVEEWSRWEEAILLVTEERQAYQRWGHTLKRRLKDLKNLSLKIHESIEEYKQTYKARVESADVINELKMKVDEKRKELSVLNDSIERESLTYSRLIEKANLVSLTSKILVRQPSSKDLMLKRTNSQRNNSVFMSGAVANGGYLPTVKSDDNGDAASDDGNAGLSIAISAKGGHWHNNDDDDNHMFSPNNHGHNHDRNPFSLETPSGKEHSFPPSTPNTGGGRRKSVVAGAQDFAQTPNLRSNRRASMSVASGSVAPGAFTPTALQTSSNSRRQVDDPNEKATKVKQKRQLPEAEMSGAQDKSEELFREIRRSENFWMKNEKEAFMIASSEDTVCPASAKDLSSYYALHCAKGHISRATELRKDLQNFLEVELRAITEVISLCELEKRCYTDVIGQIVADSEQISNLKRDIEVEVGHESSKKKLEQERIQLFEIKEQVTVLDKEIKNHQRMLQSTLGSHAHSTSNNSANNVIAEEQSKRQECIDQATKFDALSIQKESEIDTAAIERIGKEFHASNNGNAPVAAGVSSKGDCNSVDHSQLCDVMTLYDKESQFISDAIRYRKEQCKALEAAMQHIRREQDLMQFGKLDQSRTDFEKISEQFKECHTALETDLAIVISHHKDYVRKKEEVQHELHETMHHMVTYGHFLAKIPEGMLYLNSPDYIRLKKAYDNLIKKIKNIQIVQNEVHEKYQLTSEARVESYKSLSENTDKIAAKLKEAENDYQQYVLTKDNYSDTVTILTESKDTAAHEIPKFAAIMEQITNEKKLIEQEVKLLDDELQYINAAKLYLDEVRLRVGTEQARSACRSGLGRILAGSHGFIPNNAGEGEGFKWRKRLFKLKRQNGGKPLSLIPAVFQESKLIIAAKTNDSEISSRYPHVTLPMEGTMPSFVVFDQKESAPDDIFDPRTLPPTHVKKVLPIPSNTGYAPVFMVGVGRAGRTTGAYNPQGANRQPNPSTVVVGTGGGGADRPQSSKALRTMTPPATMPSYDQYDIVQANKVKRTMSVQKMGGPAPVQPTRSYSTKSDYSLSDSSDELHSPTLVVLTELQKLEKKIADSHLAEIEFNPEKDKRAAARWREVNGGLLRTEDVDMEKLRRDTVFSEEELQEQFKRMCEPPKVNPESSEEKESGIAEDDDDSTGSSVSSTAGTSYAAPITTSALALAALNSPQPPLGIAPSVSGRLSLSRATSSPLNLTFMPR